MRHDSAIIDASARIAADVEIGAYSVIGADVEIASGTVIGPHVVVMGPSKIGHDNRIFQFSSIGEAPQDKKYQGERTWLELGDRNVIREFVTLNRGTDFQLFKNSSNFNGKPFPQTHIQIRKRLVQKQKTGIRCQSPCKGDTLLLATG